MTQLCKIVLMDNKTVLHSAHKTDECSMSLLDKDPNFKFPWLSTTNYMSNTQMGKKDASKHNTLYSCTYEHLQIYFKILQLE